MRMPRRSASANSASTDCGYTAQNTSAVVVPLRSNSSQNTLAIAAA
jgi:hypothetical protein